MKRQKLTLAARKVKDASTSPAVHDAINGSRFHAYDASMMFATVLFCRTAPVPNQLPLVKNGKGKKKDNALAKVNASSHTKQLYIDTSTTSAIRTCLLARRRGRVEKSPICQ